LFVDAGRQSGMGLQDGIFGGFEDAIEAAQHDERQDNLAIF